MVDALKQRVAKLRWNKRDVLLLELHQGFLVTSQCPLVRSQAKRLLMAAAEPPLSHLQAHP